MRRLRPHNHAELLLGLDREFREFIQVNGEFFRIFMSVQAGFAIFLAAMAGPAGAPDLASNALPLLESSADALECACTPDRHRRHAVRSSHGFLAFSCLDCR